MKALQLLKILGEDKTKVIVSTNFDDKELAAILLDAKALGSDVEVQYDAESKSFFVDGLPDKVKEFTDVLNKHGQQYAVDAVGGEQA